MKIEIQDTFNGKRATSRFVTLFWVGRDFFAEKSTVRIEFLDENSEYLDHLDHVILRSDYVSLGPTDEEKADAILVGLGILKAV